MLNNHYMSKEFELDNVLRCYFFGMTYGERADISSSGLAGFAIPDLGILYKDRFVGTLYESQYEGLLILLRFLESNLKNFKGLEFEIYSDAAVVVYQILHKRSISRETRQLYESAISIKSRLPYKINWIPSRDNPALSGLLETPPLKSSIDIKFEEKKRIGDWRLGKGHLRL